MRRLVPIVLVVGASCGPAPAPSYVGSSACAACHAAEHAAWTGSHHDLAMQVATDSTVLGNFDGTEFDYFGRATRFYRESDRFMVRTEGSDGLDRDFQVTHAFGVAPLQQYLVPVGGGRMQALSVAWDSRPAENGGQRWFHLYPGEPVRAGDPLHWTGLLQNWNTMCAACHSTALRKNYDLVADSFATTWDEIDVGCEACHGPASAHVEWARALGPAPADGAPRPAHWPARGAMSAHELRLVNALAGPSWERWATDPETGSARPLEAVSGDRRIETCAPCHSRRAERVDGFEASSEFDESFRLSLLEEGLYHADGQIDDEVYVYASFLQSKMYASGVVCSDCHEPHTLRLRAPGNAVCARCHQPDRFDGKAHHGHRPDSTGGQCVACHMPSKNYMVVDPRLDHSIRVPDPALSARTGSPDACAACHPGKGTEWSVGAIRSWGGGGRPAHYGDAFAAARSGQPGTEVALAGLVTDTSSAAVVRATALSLLARYPSRTAYDAIVAAFDDRDTRVRVAAVEALEFADAETRLGALRPLLDDRSGAVRAAVGRVLAPVPSDRLSGRERDALEAAIAAYVREQNAAAERPEAHQNLALVALGRGDPAAAEAAYRSALRLGAWFTPAYANLSDLLRSRGDVAGAEAVLRDGLVNAADRSLIHHALGLHLVREGRMDEAVTHLRSAAENRPEVTDYAYVLGLALVEAGDMTGALATLRAAHDRSPQDARLLQALATISRDAGRRADAVAYAEQLLELLGPGSGAQALVDQLRGGE